MTLASRGPGEVSGGFPQVVGREEVPFSFMDVEKVTFPLGSVEAGGRGEMACSLLEAMRKFTVPVTAHLNVPTGVLGVTTPVEERGYVTNVTPPLITIVRDNKPFVYSPELVETLVIQGENGEGLRPILTKARDGGATIILTMKKGEIRGEVGRLDPSQAGGTILVSK